MDQIRFVHLSEIKPELIIDLMNNELVGKQMPLLNDHFTETHCKAFLDAKHQLWQDCGYGPWGFLIDNNFAGWGGLQPENGEPDFALVLHPDYWGWGLKIFNKIKNQAFNEMNLTTITILLPPSRPNSKAVTRMGFIQDGNLTINGENFKRFRLNKE